jgi:hypothetical protein
MSMLMFTQYCGTTKCSFARLGNGEDSTGGGTGELPMAADCAASIDGASGVVAGAVGTKDELAIAASIAD